MRGTASLAVPLLALAIPTSAHATTDSTYYGSCAYDLVLQETADPDQYRFVGHTRTATALYSHSDGTVVNATVTCQIFVNDVLTVAASGWGSGVVAFAAPVSFDVSVLDDVEFCTVVDFTSDDTPTATYCPGPTTTEFPPNAWVNFINGSGGWAGGAVVTYVDPALCAATALLAPGVPPLTTDPTGDVFVEGELFWDCPPYEWEVEPWPPGEAPPPPYPPYSPYPPRSVSGAGYNTGDAGVRALLSADRDAASACTFVADRVAGTATVLGATAAAGAQATSIRCLLTDTATGAVLYDETVPAGGASAILRDSVAVPAGAVTVCTEGTAAWDSRAATVELDCRPGEPLS